MLPQIVANAVARAVAGGGHPPSFNSALAWLPTAEESRGGAPQYDEDGNPAPPPTRYPKLRGFRSRYLRPTGRGSAVVVEVSHTYSLCMLDARGRTDAAAPMPVPYSPSNYALWAARCTVNPNALTPAEMATRLRPSKWEVRLGSESLPPKASQGSLAQHLAVRLRSPGSVGDVVNGCCLHVDYTCTERVLTPAEAATDSVWAAWVKACAAAEWTPSQVGTRAAIAALPSRDLYGVQGERGLWVDDGFTPLRNAPPIGASDAVEGGGEAEATK